PITSQAWRPGGSHRRVWRQVIQPYEEARAVLEWAKSSGAKSVIIPTELFPARRVRWIFRHEATPAGVRIIAHAIIKPPGYGVENWWKDEGGLKDFKNEVIKFVYYLLRY